MPDAKLTDLTELTAPALSDILYAVSSPGSSPESRKVPISRLLGVLNSTNDFRLTTESGVSVSTSDRTAQSTIFLTPHIGNEIALYDGTAWQLRGSGEVSLALSGLTSARNYDVFALWSGSAVTLELSAAWTNDTTRAEAVVRQDGVWCKSGALTRRLVGTIRTTGTTTTEDSLLRRFVWNADNRISRLLLRQTSTSFWTYATVNTWQQAAANTANQVEYVVGLNDRQVTAVSRCLASHSLSSGANTPTGVGVDSTTANSAILFGGYSNQVTNALSSPRAEYVGFPGIGYHRLVWLERTSAATATFYGFEANNYTGGISGSVEA